MRQRTFGSSISARPTAGSARRIPCLADELQAVAVGIANVGGVVARCEVGSVGRFAFVDSTGSDGSGVSRVDHLGAVTDDAQVEARLAGYALSQPDTRADLRAGDVVGVTDAEQVRHAVRAGGGVVVAERAPARGAEGLEIEGQRPVHAWLWLDDATEAQRLLPGDLAIAVGGQDHHIADEPDPARCVSHEQFWVRAQDADPEAAVFLCGAYRLAGDVGRSLIQALPPVLVIRPSAHDQVHDVVALISRELQQPAPGSRTVLDRLLDVLLMLVLRTSYDQSPGAPRWYRAAEDPRLGRALRAMHEKPDHAWTVPELVQLTAMSRTTFARKFERALGQTPMQYPTDWRLTLARDYLLSGELTLDQIARETGYTSPNAFAATFRRHHGLPPGRWREANTATQVGPFSSARERT
nr:AraC family transcriptional regulator [Nocardia terpenica]